MYKFYFEDIEFPFAPEKIETKIKGNNKTYTLINEGEINVLKEAGLTEITFTLLLPNVAPYGFEDAAYYLKVLEGHKTDKAPFRFIVVREFPNGDKIFDTNMAVALENYTVKEDSSKGFDIYVSVTLKQYRDYGVKEVKVLKVSSKKAAKPKKKRKVDSAKAKKKAATYTVKAGDCLSNIAAKQYGDSSKWPIIYEANKDKIANPNLINVGQKLVIPAS